MKNLLFLFLALSTCGVFGQNDAGRFKWWNPAENEFSVLEGQAWPKEVKNPYDRLPARAEGLVRDEVWQLSRNAAGLKLRFKTNARSITVRYQVERKNYAMNHFPATGVSGVDLYSLNNDGSWAWATGTYKFSDTISYTYRNLDLHSEEYPDGREYHLYLPLYNNVSWLEVGVPQESSFTALPPRGEKPIVVYGTSIAQGGCASRPGMAWTAILERDLHRPVVNLGFSGNGRLEKEVIDLLLEIDAGVIVLDCLPNLKATDVESRLLAAVRQIRKKRPSVPVLLTQHSGFTENRLDAATRTSLAEVNAASKKAFRTLTAEGVKNLYLLDEREVSMGADGTVDGSHPTDLGMYRYAEAYRKALRSVLKD